MMRNTRNRLSLVVMVCVAVLLALMVQFVLDQPVKAAGVGIFVYAMTRPSDPFCYTSDLLTAWGAGRGAHWVDLFLVLGGFAVAGVELVVRGFAPFLVSLVAVYVADRVIAWTLREQRAFRDRARPVGRPDVVIDAEVGA